MVWPGLRRAGLRKAEPGAGAGPAAPQAPPCSHTRPDSAGGPRLGSSECPFEKPTVLQTAPLYPSGSLGRMNRFKMKTHSCSFVASLRLETGRAAPDLGGSPGHGRAG